MGIKTYNPYTPSRRNMTGSDFSEITKTTPEKALTTSLTLVVTIRERSPSDITAVETEENTESSTSRETAKTEFRQRLLVLSTIRTEQQTSL